MSLTLQGKPPTLPGLLPETAKNASATLFQLDNFIILSMS